MFILSVIYIIINIFIHIFKQLKQLYVYVFTYLFIYSYFLFYLFYKNNERKKKLNSINNKIILYKLIDSINKNKRIKTFK